MSAGLMIGGCDTSDLGLRPGATSVFQMFEEPSAADAATMAIDPYDPERRYQGTLVLANQPYANEAVYQRLFLDNIKDEDPGVRAAATRGIANHGSPDQAAVIIARLKDSDPMVRREAARGLQRLHSRDAIDPLLSLLDERVEPEAYVRAEAAHALGQYAEPRVLQKLIAALDDPQLSVNRNTVQALRTLTGQDFGADRGAWVRWLEKTREPFAARALYIYPTFSRGRYWFEHLPLVPPPPNEPSASPAGMSPVIE